MKHFSLILFCSVLLLPAIPALADEDCDATLREAKTAFDAGDYAKAKKYYDYVVDICGGTYGNASSWSQKCQEALTPRLSVSRSNISVGASSGTTSITVTSNRSWKLTNTSSTLFTVSKSGDNVSISYSANLNTTSRADYFDVVTTDGSKSVRINITQDAKSISTPYLTVNKTSISTSSHKATEYITVSSNTTWEVQYPSGDMYSVTRDGNTLTVKIFANTSSESRSDFFNVRTTDGSKVQKISLSQAGTSSSNANRNASSPSQYQISQMTAEFTSAYITHNVMNNGEKCMEIHSHFSVANMKGYKAYVIAWVYDDDGNNQTSYRTEAKYATNINSSTHAILSWETITPRYDNSEWKDYVLYLPNALLSTGGYVRLEIREYTTDKTLAYSNRITFTYGNK